VYASNWPDAATFAKLDCGAHVMDEDGSTGNEKTQMFNLGYLGYRYSLVKYLKGSNTQGTLTIIALGKKGG